MVLAHSLARISGDLDRSINRCVPDGAGVAMARLYSG